MKTKYLILTAFLLVINFSIKADDFDILYTRLYADVTAGTPVAPATILTDLNLMAADGHFTDLNYDELYDVNLNSSWHPGLHFWRLMDMALAYKKAATGNTYFGSAVVKEKIRLGLMYWYNRIPQPTGSWADDGVQTPKHIAYIITMMKNDFTGADYNLLCVNMVDKYLVLPADYATSTFKNRLFNCIDFNEAMVYHGMLHKDQTILQQAITYMIAQMKITPVSTEGTQVDGSFQVHGFQIYNPGYGMGITDGISYWVEKTTGLTKKYFSQANLDLISHQLLNGDQWMLYGKVYDFSTMGRQLTSSCYKSSTPSTKDVCVRMIAADPANASRYQQLYDHINSVNGSVNGVTGNRFFYRSDYMAHRRAGKFIGVKMCSPRTTGTESMIGQNRKGIWMPIGATCIHTNANEYMDIFPFWDWSKIPGVTNPAVEYMWPNSQSYESSQRNVFVGAVSDGVYGAAAMDLLKNDVVQTGVTVDIAARKSWFMFDDEMVALGAGITSAYAAAVTTTTLNQSLKNGNVSVNGAVIVTANNVKYAGVTTVYHDNTGYVFRTPTNVNLSTSTQSGTWNSINAGLSNATVTGSVFKLWLDHGAKPTDAMYEYIVLPNKTATEVAAYSTNIPLNIVNTKLIQAVTHKTLKITEAVFYSSTSGALVIENGPTITANYPCALIIDRSVNPLKITVADPSQYRTAITVTVNYGGGKSENLAFTLPTALTGNMGGSSVTKTATILTDTPNNVKLSHTTVYPNPSNGQFTVKSDNAIRNIEVYNVLGKKVNDLQINGSDNISLNLGLNYPEGVYVLNVNYLDKTQEKVSIIKMNK